MNIRNSDILEKTAHLFGKYQKVLYKMIRGNGVDVIDRDWDNLIILDACRFDYFQKQNQIPGDLSSVLSQGGHSWEFMEKNFIGRELNDTVYITANPYSVKLPENLFYTIESALDRWDDEHETVFPSDVVELSIESYERYPNKRLIIHFMQPHEPWIGPTMDRILERMNLTGYDKSHARNDFDSNINGKNPWKEVKNGNISLEEMRQAYTESLDRVLRNVEHLITRLDGKSVITSDHGELLGDMLTPLGPRLYGHPHFIYTKNLRKVPWLEINSNNRRNIISEEPVGFEHVDQDVVDDRLHALGYKSDRSNT
jgi:hypothetical protein